MCLCGLEYIFFGYMKVPCRLRSWQESGAATGWAIQCSVFLTDRGTWTFMLERWVCRGRPWPQGLAGYAGARSGVSKLQNFRRDAPWIATMWSPQTWKNWPAKSPCELFRLAWFSALNIAPDWMHCKYIGYDQFFYGSILFLLTHHLLHSDIHTNMLQVRSEIQAIYRSE